MTYQTIKSTLSLQKILIISSLVLSLKLTAQNNVVFVKIDVNDTTRVKYKSPVYKVTPMNKKLGIGYNHSFENIGGFSEFLHSIELPKNSMTIREFSNKYRPKFSLRSLQDNNIEKIYLLISYDGKTYKKVLVKYIPLKEIPTNETETYLRNND